MIQTFGSAINFHPHVHALVSRGGWTADGQWVAVPWVEPRAAELLFRHKVLALLRRAALIDQERIALLLSWKHSGFSVHNSASVRPEDAGSTERLVRYLMRAPVSQERMEIELDLSEVRLRPKAGADDGPEEGFERLDPDEVVARIIAQVPEPRKHLVHYYGHYANAARAKRAQQGAMGQASETATASAKGSVASEPDSAQRKAARKRWANLIRHIYEADPLVCPRCGAVMKIIAFITERQVIRAILASVRRSTPSAAGSRHPPPPARPLADGVS